MSADRDWHALANRLGVSRLDALNAQMALWFDSTTPVREILTRYSIPAKPTTLAVAARVRRAIHMHWARFHKRAITHTWGSPSVKMYHESMVKYHVRQAREFNCKEDA